MGDIPHHRCRLWSEPQLLDYPPANYADEIPMR